MPIQWNPLPFFIRLYKEAASGDNTISQSIPEGKIWRIIYARALNGTKKWTKLSIAGVTRGGSVYLTFPQGDMVSSNSEIIYNGDILVEEELKFYYFDCDAGDNLEAVIVGFEGIKQ